MDSDIQQPTTPDPDEIVAISIETLGGRDVMVSASAEEIARFCDELKKEDVLANRGVGLTITNDRGDIVQVIAGIDIVRLYTRATIEDANEKARFAVTQKMITTGRR